MNIITRLSALSGAAAILLLAAGPAAANQPIFRCSTASGVTYTHVPCAGARQVDASGSSRAQAERHAAAPQDRARAMTRAHLPDGVRHECGALDARMREEEAGLRQKAEPTPADEKALLQAKFRYRELKC